MSQRRITASVRRIVADRARHYCEYCRGHVAFAMEGSFSVEHIIPRSLNGTNALENLALSCQGCNNHKYIRTEVADPVTGVVVPLFHPRTERWRDHFRWSDDLTLIVGLTPTGRATVAALQLNRVALINLRRIYPRELHPPPEAD